VGLALAPLAVASIAQGMLHFRARQQEIDQALRETALYATQNEQSIFTGAEQFLKVFAQRPELYEGAAQCSNALANRLVGATRFLNLTLIDARGIPVCMAVPMAHPIDYARLAWWPEIRTHRGLVIGDQFTSPDVGKPVLPLALPLYDRAGAFAGALSLSLDMQWLNRNMQYGRLPPEAIMLIVDRSGRIVASNKPVPEGLAHSLAEHGRKPQGKMFSARTGTGTRWNWAAEPIGTTDKFVAFGMPEPSLFGMSRIFFVANILIPVLMVVLASVAIWLATEWLVIRWTTYLKRVSAAYSQNHFALELKELDTAPDEFRLLGREMKNMASSIQDRDRTLSHALERKSAMAREIHHRVKNNLQIVSSLISLYSQKVSDDGAQTAFRQITARVDTLTLIQRLIEKSDTDPIVDMETLFAEMADQIRELASDSGRSYKLALNVEDWLLPPDIATPLALFAVEALTFELFQAQSNPPPRSATLSFSRDSQERFILAIEDGFLGADTLRAGTPSPDRVFTAFAEQLNGEYRLERSAEGDCRLSLRVAVRPGAMGTHAYSRLGPQTGTAATGSSAGNDKSGVNFG
jgi:two-component sensor histidine kinase